MRWILFLLFIYVSSASLPAAGMISKPALGINLAGPADWNTELPFVDVFRLSRSWISQRKGESWGKGPELLMDRHGWVTRLETDCWAETPLCTIEGGHYPAGVYSVFYEGNGRLEFSGNVKVVERGPGKMKIEVDSSKGAFFLKLMETDAANPVRNIRVFMPGFSEKSGRWHPAFLKRWQGMASLRFMDFQETNNSKQRSWKERPLTNDATYTRAGVPVEAMVDLANELKADPWFCMPHLASDEYIREFARLVKKELSADRKVYLEYSNEIWNSQFKQHQYAAETGQKLGLAEKSWEAAWRYTAQRSAEIFKIWEEVFGGTNRLVRVLPSQAANSYISGVIAAHKDAYRQADVLAIAPYVSCNISREGKRVNQAMAQQWAVEDALRYMKETALPETIEWIRANKKIADKYGLKLVCYEAGQHMVGVGGVENDAKITATLLAANAHPEMGKIYDAYYQAWEENGGDLLCHFSSVSKWSKWGSWGLLQYADDDAGKSPKMSSTLRWGKSLGQKVMEAAP